MSNTIRPKISEELKKIASADKSGQSKAKIDTKHEYDLLKNYLANNLEEFTPEEKNTLTNLLNKAKQMLGLKDDTKTKEETTDSSNEPQQDQETEPTNPEDPINEYMSKNKTDSSNEPQQVQETEPGKPVENSSEETTDSSNEPQQDQETESGKTNEHGTVTKDDDSKQDGNTKQKGEKVVIDGKICIKMPSGDLYDARTGRKIKS